MLPLPPNLLDIVQKFVRAIALLEI